MDFIERLLGVSPDGGSGALEFALLLVPALGLLVLGLRRSRATRRPTTAD
jgi:hypothetical protein